MNLKISKKFFVQTICILLLLISNISFVMSAFSHSLSYKYPELNYLLETIFAGDFIITNYFGIGSYMKEKYFSVVWVMPSPKEEFATFISSLPEGSKVVIFKRGFSSRIDKYVGEYFTRKDFLEFNSTHTISFHFYKAIRDICEIYWVKSGKVVANHINNATNDTFNVSYSWFVDTANVSNINEAYVCLNIMLKSGHEGFVTIIVGSETFSRVYTLRVTSSNNIIALKFKICFNGLQYGSVVARMSRLIVLDDEGQILLDDVIGIHMFTISDALCYCILISVTLLVLLMDLKYSDYS